jgi:electron transport complex protein RnfB
MNSQIDPYRELQRHLDKMPVGYPPTKSGVEIRLLKRIFTPEQAAIATHLHYKHKSLDEIYDTAKEIIASKEELQSILDDAVSRGGIFRRKRDGRYQYALLPFILWGMYEHQLKRLDQEFVEDSGEYLMGEFGLELATSTLPKMRVIPVDKSVTIEHNVATYDEMREIIKHAGDHIAIQDCFCRKVADMQDKPCKATERREVCMSLGDLAELYVEEGWARKIDQQEALEIVGRNEEEGLVLMLANEQEPNFMCACCSDCCGMMMIMKNFPKPAEVVGSNYYARVDPELCKGCGTCITRCPIDAVIQTDSISSINLKRCIGCGLCVPTCPENAMMLVAKEKEVRPPETVENHLDTIYARRTAFSGRLRSYAIKSMLRIASRFAK